MTIETWPNGLRGNDGQIRKENFADDPADNLLLSQMDDGQKTRRKYTRGYSTFKGTWRFTLAEYEIFRLWVRDVLMDGSKTWAFNHPLRPYVVAANFIPQDGGRAFATAPDVGANIFVRFELSFIDRAFT